VRSPTGIWFASAVPVFRAQLLQGFCDVVILRFGLEGNQPRTLEQIGKQFGLSRERVRQIERETMAKLRDPQRADALRDYLA